MVKDFELLKRGHVCDDGHLESFTHEPKAKIGLVVVFTGNGKGKTSAAFHMAQRAVAANQQVGIIQFCGGSPKSCEYTMLGNHPLCEFKIFGSECTWKGDNRINDLATVNHAWQEAVRMMSDHSYDMVVLDEIHLLLKHNYLKLDDVIRALRKRPKVIHVVMTGRHAPVELIDFADLATEMREVKHPHGKLALPPQVGIEF